MCEIEARAGQIFFVKKTRPQPGAGGAGFSKEHRLELS